MADGEYDRGGMDVASQQQTFSGFIRWSRRSTAIVLPIVGGLCASMATGALMPGVGFFIGSFILMIILLKMF